MAKFDIKFQRITDYTMEHLETISKYEIFFTIDNVSYTNRDINQKTKYLFAIFMLFDFFINKEIIPVKDKNFFNHKYNFGANIVNKLMNKLAEYKDLGYLVNVKIYFNSFFEKDTLHNYLHNLINNIEDKNLRIKLIISLNYIISNYKVFFDEFNDCIITMGNINKIPINSINYYFIDDSEIFDTALILYSLYESNI
jgi:hypothetical protein